MWDEAFDALRTYDWGTDPAVLRPIEEAAVATRCDPLARQQLEQRLIAMLGDCVSRDAKDFACRMLKTVGTAAATPALEAMLPYPEHSHMARYALESMPCPQAGRALRRALPVLSGPLLAGVLGSLGARREAESVAAIAPFLGDDDPAAASAAASALGAIGTAEAAAALAATRPASDAARRAAIDASLACAERLLAAGNKTAAQEIYGRLAGENRPKHIRVAAARGMLASRK
jgi:HEAT repeat protein